MNKQLICLITTFMLTTLCLGQTIKVPEDYSSIQAAIDASSNRDSILVNRGTYYENLNFKGKAIVLVSYYIYTEDPQDIEKTIIDGSQATNPDTASVVVFCSGEGPASILQGFTITGGSGTRWIDPQIPTYTWHSGGGVFMFNSSPTIRDNNIIGNHSDDDSSVDGASGGGMLMYKGNPRIFNNIISHNTARYGAGIVVDYSGCYFHNNIVVNNRGGQVYGGGAFWMIGSYDKPVVIENNTIYNNEAVSPGVGGAFYLWGTDIIARNNIIWGNKQSAGGQVAQTDGAVANISFSIVEGGFEGEGNLNLDPQFSNPEFLLDPSSPCIDSGNPNPLYDDIENPDNPGFALSPSQGTLTNDMGAYGGQDCFCRKKNTSATQLMPIALHVQCYPNPFNSEINIDYSLSQTSHIQINITNLTGSMVKQVRFADQPAGYHQYRWTGSGDSAIVVSPGVYFCTFIINNLPYPPVKLIRL